LPRRPGPPHRAKPKKSNNQIADRPKDRFSRLGGDPAAPSGTATLLRLSASYQAYPRQLPPEG